jgi:NAD(P)-dependent dehydrogenase (short-subunit alcohol dehydrogenase family)
MASATTSACPDLGGPGSDAAAMVPLPKMRQSNARDRGVTVNAVTPGFIATDMVAGMPEKALDRVRGQIPMGRLGRPEEVARVVSFLAADGSGYITGQVWGVNGGLDM